MDSYRRLLLANRAWADEKTRLRATYFKEMAVEQRPDFLWIGCSDSRVPANEVTGTEPGEIFVHRNIANMVVHTDLNILSVLQYAVDYLKVKHIIVCGHTGCGGVRAALTRQHFGLLNKWLRNLKEIYRENQAELDGLVNLDAKTDRLAQLSVMTQVLNLAKTSIVQRAWLREQRPTLHGWVFDMQTGLLNTIKMMNPGDPMDDIFRYEFPEDLLR